MVKTLRMPILWPVRLSARTRDFHSLKRSSILLRATGSNLEVIKTQGVLKGYTEDNYQSYHVEDSILHVDIIVFSFIYSIIIYKLICEYKEIKL